MKEIEHSDCRLLRNDADWRGQTGIEAEETLRSEETTTQIHRYTRDSVDIAILGKEG